MAEVHRQREIGAARVVNRHEISIRDNVHRLLAAIVRMRAPTDVAKQAGGMPQALLVRRLFQARRRNKAVGPGDQLLTVPWRA